MQTVHIRIEEHLHEAVVMLQFGLELHAALDLVEVSLELLQHFRLVDFLRREKHAEPSP